MLKRIIAIIFMSLLFFTNNYGQKNYTPTFADPLLDKYRWRHYKELSGKNFTCFCEQQNGTMWFGIENGIMSYDGYKWKEYLIPTDKSKISQIRSMVFFGDTLLMGGENGILSFVKGEWGILKFAINSSHYFKDMLSKGRFYCWNLIVSNGVVLGASTYGIYIRKNGKDHLYTNEDIIKRYKQVIKELEFHTLEPFGKGLKFYLSNVFDAGDNTYYGFLTRTNTKNKHFKFKLIDDINNPIEFIEDNIKGKLKIGGPVVALKRPNGEIWVVSESYTDGLNILRNNKWEYFSFKQNLKDSEVSWNILNLSDSSALITSLGVIYRYYNNQWSKIKTPIIPFKSIHTNAKFNKNGDLWLGDENGEVYKIDYNTKHWTIYSKLNYQFTRSDSSLWFLSDDNKVVFKKENNWFYYDHTDGLISDPQTLYLTKNGTIWCGGSQKLVSATAYLKNNKWIIQKHDSLSWGINFNGVAEDNNGDVWFAAASEHKGRFGQLGGSVIIHQGIDDIEIRHFHKNTPPNIISSIAYSEKKMYFGTNNGIYFFKNNKLEPGSLIKVICNRLILSSSGSMFVATKGKGVMKFTNDKDTVLNTLYGLASDVVYDLYIENDSSIWAATSQGFSYYNGRNWFNNIYPPEFDIDFESGKLSGETNNIWVSKFPIQWTRRAYDDLKFVGTKDDFFSVMYKRDSMPPETEITLYFNHVASTGNTNIEWTGIDYMNHTKKSELLYSYRLNNKEWSLPASLTNITFFGLKPGDYVFEIKAIDKDSNEDLTPANVSFTVALPVWQQAWFIIMLLVLIGTIIFLVTRIIIHNKKLVLLNKEIEKQSNELNETNTLLEERQEEIIQQNEEILQINNFISEQRDELFNANNTLKKFFSIIGHDLKGPMSSVLGLVKLLNTNFEKYDNEKKIKYLGHIQNVIETSYNLLENLLLWARAQKGNIDFNPEKIDLHTEVNKIVELLSQSAENKSITLINQIPKNISVNADINMFSTIVRNLTSNAIKFTNCGGEISIFVNFKTNANNQEYVEIGVKDNGVGISPETQSKMFEVSTSKSTFGTENEAGTGLGLIICKEFVDKHKGKIWVESEIGVGTTVFFSLPC